MKHTSTILISLICAGISLSAEARTNYGKFAELDAALMLPAKTVVSRGAESDVDKPSAVDGDFDWSYYWMDFGTGITSQTWETSKYEQIVKVEGEDKYLIKNFMKETLNPDPEDTVFEVADLVASYDESTSTFVLDGNQYLYDYIDGKDAIAIHLIGVKYNPAGKLTPDADLKISLKWDGRGFRLDASTGTVAILIGAKMPSGGYGGLGICFDCALYPWNGTMIYMVAPDTETEAMPYTCNVWAKVDGQELIMSNYADFGYTTDIVFDFDIATALASAIDPVMQTLVDLEGKPAYLYLSDSNGAGSPAYPGNYVLTAMMAVRDGATMLLQNSWGAFYLGEQIGYYSNTYTILNFDITDASAGIDSVEDAEAAFAVDGNVLTAVEHVAVYDLSGRIVGDVAPSSSVVLPSGMYIVKAAGAASKLLVR